jgi:hypothetical protein
VFCDESTIMRLILRAATLLLVYSTVPARAQPAAAPPSNTDVAPRAAAAPSDAPVAAPVAAPAPDAPATPAEPAPAPNPAPPSVEAPSNGAPLAPEPQPPAVQGAQQAIAPSEPAPAPAREAQPPPAAPVAPTSVAESEPADERGKSLYIRLAAGFAIPVGPDIADDYALRGSHALHFTGGSFATDWMGGSMLLPRLAVGLGAISDDVFGGSVHSAGNGRRSLAQSLYYFLIGPFADVYFSPPAGWHLQALLGLAHLSRADEVNRGATGFGAALGLGYDVAVDDRWNLGALARLAISPLSMSATAGQKPSPMVIEPGLLCTATFRPRADGR